MDEVKLCGAGGGYALDGHWCACMCPRSVGHTVHACGCGTMWMGDLLAKTGAGS